MSSHPSSETGYVQVNRATLYYELSGQGTTIVLLHAGICDLRMWDDQVPALAGDFRVLRYDRRGFGRSPMVPGTYSHRQDLEALIDHFGLAPVTLVGCSQGGRIALDFAVAAPERVDRLVLVSSALSGFPYTTTPPRQFAEIEVAEARGDLELVNELELKVWVDGPHRGPGEVDPRVRERVREMNRIALSAPAGLGEESPTPSALERLETLEVPALVLLGALDEEHTRMTGRAIHERLPRSRAVTMAGVAHLPNMEQPHLFNSLVRDFLK